MVKLNEREFKDWKDFIITTFAESNKFERIDDGLHGHTNCDRYVPYDKNNQTVIKVGYLHDTLIYLQYDNPLTVGFTKQQDLEYFYRYDFTPGKQYGGPGLRFIDINVQVIYKQLMEGLKGKEVQYLKDGQLKKSVIYNVYHGLEGSYPNTIYFEKRSFWKSLREIWVKPKDEGEMQTKEIDLHSIFSGLK